MYYSIVWSFIITTIISIVLVLIRFFDSLKDAHNIQYILLKNDCILIKDALLLCRLNE